MRVSEVMRAPAVVCRPTTPLGEAARLMDERNVGSVVVVDDTARVVGIVTDRDIALRGMGVGRSPREPVASIMTTDVAAVPPSRDASDAAAVMRQRGVRRIPVVDDLGRVHGVVSLDDLMCDAPDETSSKLIETVRAQAERMQARLSAAG